MIKVTECPHGGYHGYKPLMDENYAPVTAEDVYRLLRIEACSKDVYAKADALWQKFDNIACTVSLQDETDALGDSLVELQRALEGE